MSSPYKMTLDLNVLNHLGLNLYSNVAAVLSEAVANAWDADAANVLINVDPGTSTITISDDGCGMNVQDANDRFLRVGYNKRINEGDCSPGGRKLMGRKGIGKLSLFSIAGKIEVYTKTKNGLDHGFVLDVIEIKSAIESKGEYIPAAMDAEPDKISGDHGTVIKLTSLNRRATANTVTALRKRLARRFSVLGSGFNVSIDGSNVSPRDRDDLTKIQFLWELASTAKLSASDVPLVVKRDILDNTVDVDGRICSVSGWIGSAALPKQLDTVDGGNLNSIVIMARGRLIQENILDQVNEGGIYTKYLTGQIDADFLDVAEQNDIATSDRQRIIEDDPRYQALVNFVRKSLNKIESKWTDWRNELGTKQAEEKYPKLQAWIESLPPKSKKHAEKVIGVIQGLSIDDEDRRHELLRQGVLAFERLRLRESTEELAKSIDTNADRLLPLLGEHDQFEAALYLDIIRGRLNVISQFTNLVDNNEKEKVLQEYLFEHIWLLDPSWERAAGTERMEQRVQKEFEAINVKLTLEENAGRVDIKYRTAAGKHIIIELKRASISPSVFNLVQQGNKYVSATKKCLRETGKEHEPVEIVFVLGHNVTECDADLVKKQLDSIGSRVVTYERLIDGARSAYAEFIKAKSKLDAINDLLVP